ncbi:MAG: hypothetical protein AAF961_00760, partial [Planctomycetota bacterium]
DAEQAVQQLDFDVVEVADESLFDAVTFDPISGDLTFDAAAGAVGRSAVTVRAIDAGGLFTDVNFYVDVGRQNLPPVVVDFTAELIDPANRIWALRGGVADPDDDVAGRIVDLTGVVTTRTTAWAGGEFEVIVTVPVGLPADGEPDDEYASATDPHGAISTPAATRLNDII